MFRASSIICLFFGCCPSAVAGFVVPVVIGVTVKGSSFWTWPHITQKSLKTIVPLCTHLNSTASVVCKFISMWIGASLFSFCPRLIFRLRAHSVRVAPRTRQFSLTTSTTSGESACQIVEDRYGRFPTITKAIPVRVMIEAVTKVLRNQSPKSLTRNISQLSHLVGGTFDYRPRIARRGSVN